MPFEGCAAETPPSCSQTVSGVPTPATPGVWAVSHRDIDIYASNSSNSNFKKHESSFELVTDVTFIWPYGAKSAFVTGNFSNWETTVAMIETKNSEGNCVWIYSKALPPGEYQYKFIIDNIWRHAPDQPITFDERGIINNFFTVTVGACGDVTCFCSSFFCPDNNDTSITSAGNVGVMTPKTIQRIRRNIGVAYKYVERDVNPHALAVRKAYMHTEVSDRPFDVTVVNVLNLPSTSTDGTISRASSFENILETDNQSPPQRQRQQSYGHNDENSARYQHQHQRFQHPQQERSHEYYHRHHPRQDPTVPVLDDAEYAAKLNDRTGTLPHTAPYRASALCSDPTQLAYSVRARLSSPILGFNPNECHEGIRLTDTNHCAVRVQERGLYKTVRSVLPLRENSNSKIYFELFIFRQTVGGGICIGLSTKELPLNCLCGTRPNSIGYSTSGNLIRTVDGKETWSDFGDELQSGCTVGCLVSIKKGNNNKNKQIRMISTDFFSDGKYKGSACCEFVGDLEVFPTLSLFAKHARVYSLFNGQDMLFTSCLPSGEEIMTLDGQPVHRGAGNTSKSLGLEQTQEQTQVSLL